MLKNVIQSHYTQKIIYFLNHHELLKNFNKRTKINHMVLHANLNEKHNHENIGYSLLMLHKNYQFLSDTSIDYIFNNILDKLSYQESIRIIEQYKNNRKMISNESWLKLIQKIDMRKIWNEKTFFIEMILNKQLQFFSKKELEYILENTDYQYDYKNNYSILSCFLKEQEQFEYRDFCLSNIIEKTNFNLHNGFVKMLELVLYNEINIDEIWNKIIKKTDIKIQQKTFEYFINSRNNFCDSYNDGTILPFITINHYESFIEYLMNKKLSMSETTEIEMEKNYPLLIRKLKIKISSKDNLYR
jgi:hypothetical protein